MRDDLRAVLLLGLCLLVGVGAWLTPYLITGDEQCLYLRFGHCKWWWLP